MSLCEFHPQYRKQLLGDSEGSGTAPNVQDELVWGLSYRNYTKKVKDTIPLPTKKSPVDVPFKICREKQRSNRRKKINTQKTVNAKKKQNVTKKLSLLEKSVLSQRKYMDYLSTPNPKYEEPPLKKRKCPCELEPCPPRLVQLAVPNKRRVFANWKEYYTFLPTEMLMRFEEILHTDKSLDPRDARYYYKKMDKTKRKKIRAKKRLRKKKIQEKKRGDKKWLEDQIEATIKVIIDFVKEEPLFLLNYKQLLLSDGLLDQLDEKGILKKPDRNTKKAYKKTLIEVSDKFALWMDTLIRFVDIQAVDSEEDIPPLTLSTLSEEGEGESETETTLESDEYEYEDKYWTDQDEEETGLGSEWDLQKTEEEMVKDLFQLEEGEGESELYDYLGELDGDLLEKLIRILQNCSDEFLQQLIDEDKAPNIRYIDILDKLKELKEGVIEDQSRKPFLEDLMTKWAMQNDPDKVDQKILNKIHETSAILEEWLRNLLNLGGKPPRDTGEGFYGMGEGYGEGEEGYGVGVDDGGYAEGGPASGIEMRPDSDLEGGEEDLLKDDGIFTLGLDEIVDGIGKDDEIEGGIYDKFGMEGEDIFEIGPTEMEGIEAIEEEGMKEPIDILYEPGQEKIPFGEGVIKGHKPPVVAEHAPNTVCCLSLKIWSVWLMEIIQNAHSWTKWIQGVIKQVKDYAAIVRGDVKLPNGETKVLRKSEWRKFTEDIEEKTVTWRSYGQHVKDLSNSIIENFHGKKVKCCPKCLQDHLIKNVVTAHETLQALTEAMNCAGYWQRTLDNILKTTAGLTGLEEDYKKIEAGSSESSGSIDFEEMSPPCICSKLKSVAEEAESEESLYEIEEIEVSINVSAVDTTPVPQEKADTKKPKGGKKPKRKK